MIFGEGRNITQQTAHTNLIFDTVTPYDFAMSDKELVELIKAKLQSENPNYFAVIEVDKQMV